MATTLYMDNYAKQFQTVPPDMVSAVDCQSSLRAIHDKVTTTTDFDSTDIIYAGRPPKGWKWGGRSVINHGALGAGVTLACGIVGAVTKFLGAADCAAAGVKTCNVAAGIGYEFNGATDVIITIGGADCDASIDIITEFEFYAVN